MTMINGMNLSPSALILRYLSVSELDQLVGSKLYSYSYLFRRFYQFVWQNNHVHLSVVFSNGN